VPGDAVSWYPAAVFCTRPCAVSGDDRGRRSAPAHRRRGAGWCGASLRKFRSPPLLRSELFSLAGAYKVQSNVEFFARLGWIPVPYFGTMAYFRPPDEFAADVPPEILVPVP
jgi:hypothetical protein